MAELERLANHFGDIGAICNDAAFTLMYAHCGVLRERTLRAAKAAFGHRLMMDAVVPGGVAVDLTSDGAESICALIRHVRTTFPGLVQLYDNTASLQDRTVGTGVLERRSRAPFRRRRRRRPRVGPRFRRAARLCLSALRPHSFKVPTRREGDVNARVWVRIEEVGESLDLIEAMVAGLPDGPIRAAPVPSGGSARASALVEAFRGDVFAHVRLVEDRDDRSRCHLRDASWFQWPLLEAVIEGNIVADFPLCNKSFNCSYSGCDL